MPTFPDVLLTTYVPLGTPNIKALDLNSIQIEHVRRNRDIRGDNLVVGDDFLGDQLDRTVWAAPVGSPTLTFGADPTNGAGILNIAGAGGTSNLATQVVGIGTQDFRLRARIKWNWAASPSLSGLFGLGYSIGSPGQNLVFSIVHTQANVQLYIGSNTPVDSGVVVPSGYATYEIRKTGSTLLFLINDVAVYSGTWTTAMTTSTVWAGFTTSGATSNCNVDYVKLWVERSPVTSATGAAVTGSHVEVQEISFAGVAQATMTFAQAFGNANYHLIVGIPVGSDPAPDFSITTANKQTGQAIIDSADTWTGTITVIAFE